MHSEDGLLNVLMLLRKSRKCLYVSSQVLAHYDPKLPIKTAADASSNGIRADSHVYPDGSERPIAFTLRTLSRSERNYAVEAQETTAVDAFTVAQLDSLPVTAEQLGKGISAAE